jgi:putative phosphoribosyl transferase
VPFVDRADAGRRLADRLQHLRGEGVVVLGLPRGGVPVALEVARALDAPLDVIVVRKLGVPFRPELGMGAVGEGGVRIIDQEVVRLAQVPDAELAAVEHHERAELQRRVRRFHGDRARIPLAGKTAVVVDDGIATGSTARAACQVARAQGASRVVLAVPVAPPGWNERLDDIADELVCLETPEPFLAIGQWYADFTQTTDEEVIACLERQATRPAAVRATMSTGPAADPWGWDDDVQLDAGPVRLAGHLTVPEHPTGLVLFAHGSGSSRHSPRNRFVAGVLNEAGLTTLLFDLLTVREAYDRANVFDIRLLARRLVDVTGWLRAQPGMRWLPVGYFGANTGAAAALWAAADAEVDVAAVVSRGGRPDLAGPKLAAVTAPTLLIVGADDRVVIELNRHAQDQLRCQSRLAIVPRATHLFEEPGTLRHAADLARDWFVARFAAVPQLAP